MESKPKSLREKPSKPNPLLLVMMLDHGYTGPGLELSCTCGAFLERSTTIESTTTSLHAVPSEPTTVASRAPAGDLTTVPMAAQEADPVLTSESMRPRQEVSAGQNLQGVCTGGSGC